LRPVAGGGVTFLYAVLAMAVLLGSFNAFVYWLKADNMLDDMLPYLQLLRGEGWWIAALAIGAGAPIMEELIFRGFLLSALAKSRLGFWPAAVAATSAWTMLHWGYSATGLAEVFLVGLYFSWLVWRTGSLWPAIACHALYNSSLVVFMRYAPIPT